MTKLTAIFTFTLLILSSNLMAATHQVIIENFAFTPATLEVEIGDQVDFINKDSAPHSVVPAQTSATQFISSSIMQKDDAFTLTIESQDSISAKCGVHRRMPGIEITVKEAVSEVEVIIDEIRDRLNRLEVISKM
jgi:plastocyanin